jgi:hypothetical protein
MCISRSAQTITATTHHHVWSSGQGTGLRQGCAWFVTHQPEEKNVLQGDAGLSASGTKQRTTDSAVGMAQNDIWNPSDIVSDIKLSGVGACSQKKGFLSNVPHNAGANGRTSE